MRFQSLAQAKQRALLVYLCTFNSQHHMAVPLLSRSSLHDSFVCLGILRLWDIYGLTWQPGDRVAPYQLKCRGERMQGEVLPLCGNLPMRHAFQGEWRCTEDTAKFRRSIDDGAGLKHRWEENLGHRNDTSDRKRGWAQKQAKRHEATFKRYAKFAVCMSERRQRQITDQQRLVEEISLDRLQEGYAPDISVKGAMPPTTSERLALGLGAIVRAERGAAKGIIAAAKEKDAERVKLMHDAVIQARGEGKGTLAFEDNIRAFHEDRRLGEKELLDIKKDTTESWLSSQKELQMLHAIERLHKKAEDYIIEKSKQITHAREAEEAFSRKEYKASKEQSNKEQEISNKSRKADAKAQKAARMELQKNVKEFLSKRFWIENACEKHDASRRHDKDIERAQTQRLKREELWAQKSAELAEFNYVRQEYKDNQVRMYRQRLEHMLEERRKLDSQELAKQRWVIEYSKEFDMLVKRAAAEIEEMSRNTDKNAEMEGSAAEGVAHSYRRVVESFNRLLIDSSAQDKEEEFRHVWIHRGWTKTQDEGSDGSWEEDELPDIPEDWLKRCSRLFQGVNSLDQTDNDDQRRTLIPVRPSLAAPKPSVALPRGSSIVCSHQPSDVWHGSGEVPLPCETHGSCSLPPLHSHTPLHSPAARPRASMSCTMRSPRVSQLSASQETAAEQQEPRPLGAPGAEEQLAHLSEEYLVHRTLASSKKNASAATLSTDVPGTDSAATLLSSQKSLPPALPPLNLPPSFGAFRGNPRPPRPSVTSIAMPPDQRRSHHAPFTVR